MKQELIELLEAVCNKEKEVIKNGNGPIDSLIRDYVLGFFILSHIKGYLPDMEFTSVEQVKETLLSNELYTDELSQIWDNLLEYYHGEILGVHNLVAEFHLQEQEGWNDLDLAKFMVSKDHPLLITWNECQFSNDRIRMEVVDRLSEDINLPTKRGKVLIRKCDAGAIAYLFENYKPEVLYVINDSDSGIVGMDMLKFFLSDLNNIHIIKGDTEQVKAIYGEKSFDYAYVGGHPGFHDTVPMKTVMELVANNGMAICVGQSRDSINKWGTQEFRTYRTPLVFWHYNEDNAVVCVKEPAIVENIGYFDMDRLGAEFNPYTGIVIRAFELCRNHKSDYEYVEVSKDDFLYNAKLDFDTFWNVRKGREDYAWKSFDDVLELRTNLENMYFDVDNQCIVTEEALSDNPFDLQLNTRFHLNTPNGVDKDFLDDVKYVHSGFKLVETEYCPTYKIAQHEGYQKDFYNAFDSEKCTDKELGQFFSKLLTSRMITFDAILRCGNKFRIVHASEKHPVCLQFFQIEKNWIIGELNVANNMQVYAIKEGYDAEHILHEIMTRGEKMHHYNHPDIHFLVAPDITIQKADYAKKKENYIKDLQRKRAEEEAELARLGVRNAVADLAHMLGTTFARQGSMMNTIRLLKKKGLPVADEKMSSLMDSVNYVMRVVQNFGGDFEHTVFEWQDLNACELLKSYCTEWQNAMGKRFATEVYTNECDGTTIKTDPFYLKIMLDSIFENAWRHGFEKNYTENNKVVIDLKQVSYKGRKYLLIRICNNGKPLSNDIDMDAYTTRGRFCETSGRSGLGGNHVYQIVKKHEGYMSIDGSDPEWPFAIEILLPIFSFNNVDVQHYDKSCL